MRRRETLSPVQLRELEAIDRALAGETVGHDLRELEDLVHEVRATAPQMSPALTARLERVVDGSSEPAADAVKPQRSRRWLLVPALGTVAALIVALVVVLGKSNHDSAFSPTSVADSAKSPNLTEAAKPASPADATPAPKSAAGVAADQVSPARRIQRAGALPAPAASAALTPQRRRKVERTVLLSLTTAKDRVQSTADDINQTAARFQGIVASSSVSTDDASGGEATFDLRIPTGRLDDALAALSKLGHVAERKQDLQDITASFRSTQDRLDEARAERRGLLKSLANATGQGQIESLRARLNLVRAQIASAKGQLASLQRRASYSTVNVTVHGNGKAEQGGGSWSPADAANDALRVLEVIAGIALIALAIALPLALLGIAILLGTRTARVRRRESALDAS